MSAARDYADLLQRAPGALWRLTWPEARALFARDAVALLPIGATEPHGPHLPLDVDVTIARAQAHRAHELLELAGVRSFVLPAAAYGVTFFTDGFEGRVSLQPGTLWAMLEDICDSLTEQGVRRIVFVNAHLEPAQVKVLRGVALDRSDPPSGQRAQVIFPDHTRRKLAEQLGAEFQSGECHAGEYESSIVLAAAPDGVREALRVSLPKVEVGLLAHMHKGTRSFRDAGAADAYCGDPARATAAFGASTLERLAEFVRSACRDAWPELFRKPNE